MNALRTAIETLNAIKIENQKRARSLGKEEKSMNQGNAELISQIILRTVDAFVGSSEDSFDSSYINLHFQFAAHRKTDLGVMVGLGFKFPSGSCSIFAYMNESEGRFQLLMSTRSIGMLAKHSETKDLFTILLNALEKLEQQHPFPFQPPTP